MMRTMLVLGAAAAFLWMDPTLVGSALTGPALGVVVAGLSLLAAAGAGAALLRGHGLVEGPSGWAWALGTGIALHGALMTALTFAGAVSPLTAGAVGIVLAAGWLRAPRITPPRVGTLALVVGAVLLLPAVVDALAPPTDTDELYYQLAIPRWILTHGALSGGVLHPDHSRPLPIQVVQAGLYAVGGLTAPRFWHLGISIALVLLVRDAAEARFGPGRGTLPALALLGSWSFVKEAGLSYNNVPVALWLLLATLAALDRRAAPAAWMAGLAFAAKFTAAPLVAGLALLVLIDTRKLPSPLAVAGVFVPVAPWLARNLARGDHPLFPFAGWPEAADFVFVYAEKYGVGHTALDALRLPLDLLFRAEPDSFVFLGRISLVWGLLLFAAPQWRRPDVRRLALLVAVGFVGWAVSAQLLRYLLPLAGIAALLLGAVRPGFAPMIALLVSLPANLAPAWTRAAARAAVVTGQEDADTFLTRDLPAWPAVRYVQAWVPPTDTVALLNCWPSYYIDQPYLLGSVEDHVPVRHWVFTHGTESVRALADLGVRWLVVGDTKYLRKSYRFLPETVWQTQLRAPQTTLETALKRDGVRVFFENHHAVWRIAPLDAPGATP